MSDPIIENQIIMNFTRYFEKPDHRINYVHEADAELIFMGDDQPFYLAITTDAVVEEVKSGLYNDPYQIGWMLAMVNFSDLAAVGASPMGLMLSVNYSSNQNDEFMQSLSKGISDACKRVSSYVLGGDTNQSDALFLSACAVGTIPKNSIINRVGAKSGDRCFLTGPAGLGGIYAYAKLTKADQKSEYLPYYPSARIQAGQIIRKYAHCCMDTSDGLIHSLDTLMRLNHCQFVVHDNWEQIVHPLALKVCKNQNIPPWLTLAAIHGEFELLFTVNSAHEAPLLEELGNAGVHPVLIGNVREGSGVLIRSNEKTTSLDTASIRNLSAKTGTNQQDYIHGLFDFARKCGI
ncbi:hypothetical protein BVY01_00340 [bacterium I07]|nr:hypothetical protein BVY01_00340 [bacterium I07]